MGVSIPFRFLSILGPKSTEVSLVFNYQSSDFRDGHKILKKNLLIFFDLTKQCQILWETFIEFLGHLGVSELSTISLGIFPKFV